jgi:hypothetical protein
MREVDTVDEDNDFTRILRLRGLVRLFVGWCAQREHRLKQRQRGNTIENVTATMAETGATGIVISREQDGAEWSVALASAREARGRGHQ